MSVLQQSFDTYALCDAIRRAIAEADFDAALADCHTYGVCREEGMEEPALSSVAFHGHQSGDSFVTAARMICGEVVS